MLPLHRSIGFFRQLCTEANLDLLFLNYCHYLFCDIFMSLFFLSAFIFNFRFRVKSIDDTRISEKLRQLKKVMHDP